MLLKPWQSWSTNHLSRKPVPVFDNPLRKEMLPPVPSKPALAQLWRRNCYFFTKGIIILSSTWQSLAHKARSAFLLESDSFLHLHFAVNLLQWWKKGNGKKFSRCQCHTYKAKMSLSQKYFSSGAQGRRRCHLAASCLQRRYNNLIKSPGSGEVRGDTTRIWQHIKILWLNISPSWWYYKYQKYQNDIFSCFREQPQLKPDLWPRKQELKKSPHLL